MSHPESSGLLSRASTGERLRYNAARLALLVLTAAAAPALGQSPTALADQPVFSTTNVPGNLALVLSVEFPTAISVANLGAYADASTYLGYFDPAKCYTYSYNSGTPANSYFVPAAFAAGASGHQCSGQWSGNFMNWATMQTIDPFRWALTGGYRSVDTSTQTILEKAWGSAQGSVSNFPNKGTGAGTSSNLSAALVPYVTPFSSWTNFNMQIWSEGNTMLFWGNANTPSNSANWTATTDQSTNKQYIIYIRVSVCNAGTSLGVLGLESNCVQYGSNYKPQGLIQQYSNQIRFGAVSYLNTLGSTRQGGVIREPMGFVGPTYPQPLSSTLVTNTKPEWDPTTGIMATNPDPTTATASGVSQSGVMNFLNKFGETAQSYMTYDDVSILYYTALRYYENLGNVPEWYTSATTAELDGFPAVSTWTDPILYSCQKNFILGIGDDHTWDDYNVGGGTATGSIAKPTTVAADSFNQAATWTSSLQALEGISQTPWWGVCCGGSTYYIAGLAYGAHVTDIRPDLTGTQTISTYWMDVAEYQEVENLNPYYLASKYGGFNVPAGYSITNTTPLPQAWWDTTGNTILMNGGYTQPLPDNYYNAGQASNMVSGLVSAFNNIANAVVSPTTTAFSLASPTIASTGNESFSIQYASSNWTSTLTASTLTFTTNNTAVTLTPLWTSNGTLQSQLASGGWNTGRNVATWNGSAGVPFRICTSTTTCGITSAQTTALNKPTYSSLTTAQQYLNYLRGDQTNEVGSTATGSTKSLRARTLFLGDVVDSKLNPVGPPAMSYADSYNPGYSTFVSSYASRPTMVYFGANDGMMHAFLGTTGAEQFAYVPSALFQGPTSTPQTNGLAQLGNPSYAHHFYVDATPLSFDVDVSNAGTAWKTLLIGGLGKGGTSFYAIDVTNPAAMTNESTVAGDVLWEFTDSTMGYSFGAANVVKTAKYGWVVVLTSGYDNSDGYGYLYLVNPATGALYEKIKTPSPSSGMTQASPYVQDYTNYTADSVYVGDLNGQLWRFDLTQAHGTTSPYPAPTLLATVTDVNGNAEPITSAPLIEIYPTTRKRFVMFGTGQLLSSTDVGSSQPETFYAIMDGSAGAFNTVTAPITRSNLTAVTNIVSGTTFSATSMGWYFDLGVSGSIGWRDIVRPVAYDGIIVFTALLTSANACSPGGTSEIFAVNFSTGQSVLVNNSTGYIPSQYPITDLKIVDAPPASSGGVPQAEILAGDSHGNATTVQANLQSAVSTRLLNWREVPTAN